MRAGDDESKPSPARRAGERRSALDRLPLWGATLLSLSIFVITAGVVLYVLGRPSVHGWTHLGTGDLPWKDRLLYAGAVVTLSGAVVALVVNYRKQKDAETNRFSASFAEGCRQLGDASPAVRIAGVYALAALADRYRDRRQQCIDVLCGYIRLPYNPEAGSGHLIEKSFEIINADEKIKTVDKQAYRADDREVRLTIIRTIRDHLRVNAPVSWQERDFDFTGATFDGGDFSGAVVSDGVVDFSHALFSGGVVDFSGAVFSGGEVRFRAADFAGGQVSFYGAECSGAYVSFFDTHFSGADVNFYKAQFLREKVVFTRARFSGGTVSFLSSRFAGAAVRFTESSFSGAEVDFDGAWFSASRVSFFNAQFAKETVSFSGARFSGGGVDFLNVWLSGGSLNFTHANFDGGEFKFATSDIEFTGQVNFAYASFSDGTVTIDILNIEPSRIHFTFDDAEWDRATVKVCGRPVCSPEEARRALRPPTESEDSSSGGAP